jgi:hypothetical protein
MEWIKVDWARFAPAFADRLSRLLRRVSSARSVPDGLPYLATISS